MEESSSLGTTETPLLWVVVAFGAVALGLVLLLALIYFGLRFLQGVRGIREREEEEELHFEQEALALAKAGVLGEEPLLTGQRAETSGVVAPVVAPPATPASPVAAQPGASGGEGGIPEGIAQRLTALRIVTSFQGRIPMPIPPDGLIYGLRRGGACAILARQEGPEVMEHLCRRFEMVFVQAPGGEVLVYERLQGRIPQLVDDKTA